MIATDGAGYLIWSCAAGNAYLIPTGSVQVSNYYSPATITPVGATTISLRAVYGSLAGDFINMFFDVKSNPATTITSVFQYDPGEVNGNPAGYSVWYSPVPGDFQSPPPTGTPALNSGSNQFSITGTTNIIATSTYWTAGAPTAYYTYSTGGNWSNFTTWTSDPTGSTQVGTTIPGDGDTVIILSGATVTLTANVTSESEKLTILSGGTLVLGTFQFSNGLQSLNGQGTLKLSSANFPTTVKNPFVSAGGGTTEYDATVTLPAAQTTYNNLTVNIAAGTVTQASNITLNGNLFVKQGTYLVNMGAAGTLTVNGTTTVSGTALTINNNNCVCTFDGLIYINNAANWTSTGVTLPASLTISGGISLGSGATGTVSMGAASITNITDTAGTFTDALNVATASFTVSGATTITGGIFNVTPTLANSTSTFSGPVTVTNATFNVNPGVAASLNINNTVLINGTSNFNVTNNNCVCTFTGAVTLNNGANWTSNAVTAPASMKLNGGIVMRSAATGLFKMGAGTIASIIDSAGTFTDALAIGAADFTVNGTTTITGGTFNITPTVAASTSLFSGAITISGGTFNVNPAVTRTLTFNGFTMTGGTFNATPTALTTFKNNLATTINGGNFNINNNNCACTFTGTVTLGYTGNWSSTAVTVPANMAINNGVNGLVISSTATGIFNMGAGTITSIFDTAGTFNDALNIAAADFTVTGVTNIAGGTFNVVPTLAGSTSTFNNAITISAGSFNVSPTVAATLTSAVATTLTISGGSFNVTNNNCATTIKGLVTVSNTGSWTSTAVTTLANMNINAGFTQTLTSTGTVNFGAGTISALTVNGGTFNDALAVAAAAFTVAGATAVGGGTLNVVPTVAGSTSTFTGALTVPAGSFNVSPTVAATLNFSNTTAISGGSFNITTNNCVTTFANTITLSNAGSFTSTSCNTPTNLVFKNSIINNGTGNFIADAAQLSTNALSLQVNSTGNVEFGQSNGNLNVNIGTTIREQEQVVLNSVLRLR